MGKDSAPENSSLGIPTKIETKFTDILEPYREGVVPVTLYYQRDDAQAKLTFGTQWRVTPDDKLIDDLKLLLGEEQVELEFD